MAKVMTKAQQDYARARVQSIFRDKKEAIQQEHAVPRLTIEQRTALIVAGKVPLKKDHDADSYGRLGQAFDFSAYEESDGITAKGRTLLESLEKEKTRIMDQIMLGSASEAFALIDNL